MSKCNDEAFHLARMHGLMELYGDSLGKEANPEDYESLALHFENENNNYLAGKFYLLAGAYPEVCRSDGSLHISLKLTIPFQTI
jgi:WD repeat-containing protein 19